MGAEDTPSTTVCRRSDCAMARFLPAAAMLLVAMFSTASAYCAAFVPVGTRHAWACRRAGDIPKLGLRQALHTPVLAPTRVSRQDGLVMMAKKKPKMSEAQLKALEALEAFEAATGASTTAEETPDPAEEEKKRKRAEKKARLAAKKAGGDPEAAARSGPADAGAADGSGPAPSGKKKKKGKMSDVQLRALEALEAFESSEPSDEGEEASPKAKDNESAGDEAVAQVIFAAFFSLASYRPDVRLGFCSLPWAHASARTCSDVTHQLSRVLLCTDVPLQHPSRGALYLAATACVPARVWRVCDVVVCVVCAVYAVCCRPLQQRRTGCLGGQDVRRGDASSGPRHLHHACTLRKLSREQVLRVAGAATLLASYLLTSPVTVLRILRARGPLSWLHPHSHPCLLACGPHCRRTLLHTTRHSAFRTFHTALWTVAALLPLIT